ncbi:nucleotidyltransferase family protein [Hyphomicrobium sp.]|uniref:nucleotidyltransferase family protein n=1 Tax=Hyphomicrobium sp. TaxID=82 RepID=UPI0025BE2D00|nr:nucleotidyltransferase family protein [Hyphomicrobium sp.]MCC7252285.1 nucleotidyltransferase family protein [Hyphomicrobium sp.]
MTGGAKQLPLAAVLLAGGASRRFGAANKLLAEVDGAPIVARVAREILAGGVGELVVVTGAEHDAYVAALAGLPVRFAQNAAWDEGIGGSIAAGVRALSEAPQAAFIVPGDLPNLTADVFLGLGAAFAAASGARVVVPVTAEGEQRNPVLWPRRLFPRLAAFTGAKGGKSLLDTLGDERVDVAFDDESLFADIDTPDDYARLITGA